MIYYDLWLVHVALYKMDDLIVQKINHVLSMNLKDFSCIFVWGMKQIWSALVIGRYLTILPSLQGQGDVPHQTGPHHQPAAAPAEPDTCEDHTINQWMFSQILSKTKDVFCVPTCCLSVCLESSSGLHRNSRTCKSRSNRLKKKHEKLPDWF